MNFFSTQLSFAFHKHHILRFADVVRQPSILQPLHRSVFKSILNHFSVMNNLCNPHDTMIALFTIDIKNIFHVYLLHFRVHK